MTKKDYKLIAGIFKPISARNKRFYIQQLIQVFVKDNPNFNPIKFFHACGEDPYKGLKKVVKKEVT